MTTRRALVPLLIALALLPALAGSARAQPSDADKSTARGLAMEGLAALQQKDYVTAADRLGRAEGILHAPTHLLGLARAQVGLGRWVSAQETYGRIVREGAAPGAPAAFVRAVDDARKELDALAPRVPSLVIELKGAPAATVLIDGAPIPAAALGIKRPVDPGQHVVRATADGFAPFEATVTSEEGRGNSLTLELKPVAGAPALVAPAPGPPSPRKIGGIVALGAGGALITAGAILLVLDVTYTVPLGECGPVPGATKPPYGILSAVGLAAGGAGMVTGAVLLATMPKASTQAPGKVSIAPVVAPGYVGVNGSF
jgi:hypothetical protein